MSKIMKHHELREYKKVLIVTGEPGKEYMYTKKISEQTFYLFVKGVNEKHLLKEMIWIAYYKRDEFTVEDLTEEDMNDLKKMTLKAVALPS